MTAFIVAAALFVAFAALLLRLARADLAEAGQWRITTAIGVWLLYLFHADTIAATAFTDVGRVDVPAGPFLLAGSLLGPRFARLEERHLLRQFGNRYASYRDRTPVFLTWRPQP